MSGTCHTANQPFALSLQWICPNGTWTRFVRIHGLARFKDDVEGERKPTKKRRRERVLIFCLENEAKSSFTAVTEQRERLKVRDHCLARVGAHTVLRSDLCGFCRETLTTEQNRREMSLQNTQSVSPLRFVHAPYGRRWSPRASQRVQSRRVS